MTADEEYWTWYTEHTPLARKEHTCGECGRAILKGERYRTQGGRTEDYFEWHKTCVHCDAASGWLEEVCDGWIFNGRQEDLLEHVIGHEKELRSRPLTRLARWMVADWRDRAGELRPLDDVRMVTSEAIQAYKRQYGRAVA